MLFKKFRKKNVSTPEKDPGRSEVLDDVLPDSDSDELDVKKDTVAETVVEILKTIVTEKNKSKITMDALFERDLELESIDLIDVKVYVEKIYNIFIPDEEFDIETLKVKDIVEYLKEEVKEI